MTSAMTDYIHVSDGGEVSFIPGEMTDNRTTELLPCPFCGKPIEIFNAPWADGDPGWTYWHVDEMQAAKDKCPLTMACYDTKNELIEAWNTRADYHGYEQAAIEAWENIKAWNTRAELGSGTCEDLGGIGANGEEAFHCSKCGCILSLSDFDGMNTLCTSFIRDYPRFCPECGRKVVDEC